MRRATTWVTGVLGLTLVGGGIAVFALANRRPPGWFAYAPLTSLPRRYADHRPEEPLGTGWAVLWTGGHVAGAGLSVLGLLVLVGLAGWLLGRRSGRRVAGDDARGNGA